MRWMKFLTVSFCFSFLGAKAFAGTHSEIRRDTIPAGDSAASSVKQNNFISLDSAFGKTFEKNVPLPAEGFFALFHPREKFYKTTSISSVTHLNVMEQDVSYATQAALTTQYTVSDTLDDRCTFNVAVTKLNTQVEAMGVQLQYNSQDSTQDTTSAFAKSLLDVVNKTIRVGVDTNGVIRSIDTSDTGKKLSAILAGLAISDNDFQAGNDFGLMLNHNVDSLSLGQSWSDSIVFSNGNKRIITYTVQSLLNNEIVLIVTGSLIQKGVVQSGGRAFPTDFTGTQLGKIVASKSTRLVKLRNITYSLKGVVQVDGKDCPASATSKINEIITPE